MGRLIHYLSSASTCTWEATSDGLVAASPTAGAELLAVIDVPDETHVPGTMPMLRGGGDVALLRRKRLEREFPGALLTALLPIRNRPGDGTSDIVMVAVDSSARFSATLEQLADQQALRAVYTPALLVSAWICRARQEHRRVLVVLPTPAGLRLVFVDNGKPLLSRLMNAGAAGGEAIEIARTVQYLHNTQRVQREESIEIWFWGMTQAQIEASLPAGDSCHAGETPAVAGLPDPVQEGFNALLAMAASRPPHLQLAPNRLRTAWNARLLGRWAYGVAAAILLLGCGFAALLGRESAARQLETQALKTQVADLAASRTDIDELLAARNLDLEDVLLLPEAASRLQQSAVSLPEVFTLAGRILGSHPEVSLSSLDFHVSAPDPGTDKAGAECAKEIVAADIVLEATFSLAANMDVRRHAETLAHLRQELSRSAPWQATAASAQIGHSSPLVVKAGKDAFGEDDQWSICLTLGAAS